MPWAGLMKVRAPGCGAHATLKNLVLRFEDTDEPGWLVRLYDEETLIAEALGATPEEALERTIVTAREYLNDETITSGSFTWLQL